MSWSQEIQKNASESAALVTLRLRCIVKDWEPVGLTPGLYRAPFALGLPTRAWKQFSFDDGLFRVFSASPAAGRWSFIDGFLYVNLDGSSSPRRQGAETFQQAVDGLVVEYEIHLSTTEFTGPSDPMNPASDPVDWIGCVEKVPMPTNGNRDQLYGYSPLAQSGLTIRNEDGFFNQHLYNSSFNLAGISIYSAAGADPERAILQGNVQETFRGFTDGVSGDDQAVSISCLDFLKALDRKMPLTLTFDPGNFTGQTVDPDASEVGSSWLVRRLFGKVEGIKPVCLDFDVDAPSTSNNRSWAVCLAEGNRGTIGHTIDPAKPNSNTEFYTIDTPKVLAGDQMEINESGTLHRVTVLGVNHAAKRIDHSFVPGRIPGATDSLVRPWVSRVLIEDENQVRYTLIYQRDYETWEAYGDAGNVWGFKLKNNFEANLSGFPTPFDPSKHRIWCRAHGTRDLPEYSDFTKVGQTSLYGGVLAEGAGILFKLLREAGIPASAIDKESFEGVGLGSGSLGFMVPKTASELDPPTFLELATQVLFSMMMRLGYVARNGRVLISLAKVAPLASDGETLDETVTGQLSFAQDYGDLYSEVTCTYDFAEELTTGESQERIFPITNTTARDLHQVNRKFEGELLQYEPTQAFRATKRYAIALGDRRGIYSTTAAKEFLASLQLGQEVLLQRTQLPGHARVYGEEQQRAAAIIEVQKSDLGVSLSIEDQKAIQDEATEW